MAFASIPIVSNCWYSLHASPISLQSYTVNPMQVSKYKMWLICIIFSCFIGKSLFAQDCPPSPQLRPDLYRFVIKQDNLKVIKGLEELFSSQFTKVIQDKSFPINRFDGLVDIFLDNEELILYHEFISVWFAMQFLPRIIEKFDSDNQEILGRYVDVLLLEDGIGLDFISSALPLIEGYWSIERIELAALKSYQEAQAILDRYDSGEDVSYPVPSHISENDESQLRICEIALLKSALDSLEIIKE